MKQDTQICGWVLANGDTIDRDTLLQPGQPTMDEGLCKAPVAMTFKVNDIELHFCEHHAELVVAWIAKGLGM